MYMLFITLIVIVSFLGGIAEKFTSEANKDILSPSEYAAYFRSLNTEQRQAVEYHREWCKQTVTLLKQHKPVKPYHLFLSGPGGVGKSYVIKMIHTDTVRYLRAVPGIHSDDLTALLTATTGVAAFNIEGMTVHAAFALYDSFAQGRSKRAAAQRNVYNPLSADTRNTLRNSMDNLFVVIIDEISMLSADDLYKLHMRLQEIMNVRTPDTRFGNVTVIAVGDLFQLPAIGTKVYDIPGRFAVDDIRRLHGSLWKENFMLHELTQVVRQSDPAFAALLNRLRTADMTPEDEQVLLTRVINPNDPAHYRDALHVYGTNNEADEYNRTMIETLSETIVTVKAHDIIRDKPSQQINERLQGRIDGLTRRNTGNLSTYLKLCKRAIVKLTNNIDVSDGLCNGARGTVKDFITTGNEVQVVLIVFEHSSVGSKAKASSPYKQAHPDAVPIYRHSNFFFVREAGISRKQFPLVLAFASTIHAVQGLTVDRIVCDMSTVRQAGQVYVAVSRVRTLEGLQILNYKKGAIKKDKHAVTEMERLRQNCLPVQTLSLDNAGFIVCYMNIRGYLTSYQDVQMDPTVRAADVLTLTESHLKPSHILHPTVVPDQFVETYRCDRVQAAKGGVLTFVKDELNAEQLPQHIPGLEATVVDVKQKDLLIVTIYRQPGSVSVLKFLESVEQLFSLDTLNAPNILVVGDFNEEVGGHTSRFFSQIGFSQQHHGPTTDYGSTIDHVYYKGHGMPGVHVVNTYYSDHDMLVVTFDF